MINLIIGASAIIALAGLAAGFLLGSMALIGVGATALVAFCFFGFIGKAKSRH